MSALSGDLSWLSLTADLFLFTHAKLLFKLKYDIVHVLLKRGSGKRSIENQGEEGFSKKGYRETET